MTRRRIAGGLLVVAGIGGFVLVLRGIAWMVDGGLTDYLQLLGLVLGVAAAMVGTWLLVSAGPRRP